VKAVSSRSSAPNFPENPLPSQLKLLKPGSLTAQPKQDRTVQPELERFVAQRMGAATYEADSSHVVMLSNPALVTDVIRTAANSIQGS
jgi:hypothetical protein